MTEDLRPPFRQQFDNARDPYTARNALGITGTGGSGGGAPIDADYIVAVDDPTLTNDRVLTNTATVTWDLTTPGQVKANATGFGNVSSVPTPTSGQYAKWTSATTIQGVAPATVLSDIGAQPVGSYQPLDADLTAIAALTGTNTIYYRSAANTWTGVTVGTGLSFTGGTLAATASGGGNVSNSGTPTVDQIAVWTDATHVKGVDAGTLASQTFNCGRFEYVSATACKFAPYNGDRIKINGVVYAIPSAGIAGLANTGVFVNGTGSSNLAASTLYYVYAFNNSGTITGDFSTTTHTVSSTAGNVGTEIKSGDNTRTLIGMVYTNASAQFISSTINRQVLSWFNRRSLNLNGTSTNGATTASGGGVELSTAARIYFLTWGEEAVHLGMHGSAFNSAPASWAAIIGINGALGFLANTYSTVQGTGSTWQAFGAYITTSLSEGALNYVSPMGFVLAGTGTFHYSVSAMIRG